VKKFNIGIIGDTGMVGQEISRILQSHDQVDIVYRKNSSRQEGNPADCQLIFLATRDEESMQYSRELLDQGIKVIDMSGAYRVPVPMFEKWYGLKHQAPDLVKEAVYGMPALFADQIAQARLVANPGCYPTSVILALKPLEKYLEKQATVVSTSGNSGARREVEKESNEITYSYGRRHKHIPEMEHYTGFSLEFVPIVLRSVFRGINTNIICSLKEEFRDMPDDQAEQLLEKAISDYYRPEDMVQLVRDSKEKSYGTADVNNSHQLLIKINVDSGKVYINSLIDNLMKGAASQGVENMNLMLGLPRLYGLPKPNKR